MIHSKSAFHLDVQDEPNLIPLLDFLLVLLIMFVLLAGPIHQAVKINLPQINSAVLSNSPKVSIRLTISGDNSFSVDGQSLHSISQVQELIAGIQREKPQSALTISADKTVQLETMLKVFAMTKTLHIKMANIQATPG